MGKEIELIELKEKLKKVKEAEDHWSNAFIGTIFAFLGFGGVATYFFIKKPEHYLKIGLFSGGVGLLFLLLAIPFYGWWNKASKELKELKKQERILKEKI